MKGLVFGAGFLGTRISQRFKYELSKARVGDKSIVDKILDIASPDVVINAIGKTGRPNTDWCEMHKKETYLSNVLAATNLGISCFERKIYFVHIGSGGVYTKKEGKEVFNEEDEPNFYDQVYTRSKIMAEKILKEFPCLQIRINMPLDNRPNSRNLIDKLKSYNKIADISNSITIVPDMLNALENLTENRKIGMYNLTNPGSISNVEIMTLYKEIIDPSHNFETISQQELNKFVAKRRTDGLLDTSKLAKENIKMPEVHEAVKACLTDYKKYLIT